MAESSAGINKGYDVMEDAKWYVVHTYSGYENKVKTNIEKTVENRNLQELIQEVRVPMEEAIEQTTDNEKKSVLRKMLPSYVIVKMVLNDESWYVVRNTRGVTGFVGPGSKPVALTEEEVLSIGVEQRAPVSVDYAVDDMVRVCSGPLEDFVGTVTLLDFEKQKATVTVSMLGRETPVEFDFNQIEPM